MARKRNGLVPIGEVFGNLAGPVKAIREASPQALHHFTQADQVDQLEFPRFRGHLILWENGGHDAKNKTKLIHPSFASR